MPWATRNRRPIPRSTSPRATYEIADYSKGFNSFISNDKFPLNNGGTNMWRLAQDARITTLGEYGTRKGLDFHSDAAGETQDQAITSTTGASDQSFNATTRLAQKFTAGTTGRLTKVDVNIKNAASASGTIIVALYSDSSGSPGTALAVSSIAAATPTNSYGYITARFVSAPAVTATTAYWVVVYVQNTGSGSYTWSSTSSATTAKTSTDGGSTWSSTSYALNFKQYYATTGTVKGLIRATKSDGTKVTLFAHGTSVYIVNNVSGALTAIKTGLNANATAYQFVLVNDTVYYCNSYDGLRKWDFITESQVNSTNYSNLIVHKGLLFGVRSDDPTQIDFSNFGNYETFTSTDFINVPAPKTGDPIAAVHSLNGYLLLRTYNRCYILSGEDNATFRLDDAPDQKGTYTPETSVADKNYTYFLSDDGVYRSNGTQPELLSENIHGAIQAMTNKSRVCMVVNKGRLYLWYSSPGSSLNDRCYVWNLNYGDKADTVESHDTEAYIAHAFSSYRDDDALLTASSVVGQVYWQEQASNDYDNLGGLINFELRTHYMTFSSPSVLKQIRNWEPRLAAQSGDYIIEVGYAYDLRDNWQGQAYPDVQGVGSIWGSASMVWGAFTWGATAEATVSTYVPGEYRRIALYYKHYAARQPQRFLGHTLVVETRRLR